MFFRMLGRLEVWIDGNAVPLGKNRQLVILSLLLAEVGRPVSVTRIIDALWNGDQPRTASAQVQTCVWRLRRAFAEAGADGELIETTPVGYALRVPADCVDATLFEQRVREARAVVARGDPVLAAKRLRCALALYQGPVLAEVASPVVQAIAAKWDERRLAVFEECFALELERGRGRELIDELAALVDENPLRERLRAQLMFALYSDDRRAEALEVYRVGRARLVEQLGLEPGTSLQDMHALILTGGSPRTDARHRGVSHLPAQLVADLPDYVPRPDYETVIRKSLTSGVGAVRICGLHGHWGLGKTALAVRVAHTLRQDFPDGQLFADLRGSHPEPANVADVLAGFLRALGVTDAGMPGELAERAALYRSLLDSRRVLVVLDDVPDGARIRPLLPGSSRSAVVLTSRSMLSEVPGNVPVKIGVLTFGQSKALLGNVTGYDRVAAEPEAAQGLVRAVGRHPVALRAIAARLAARRHLSLARLVERMADPYQLLDELSYGALDVRAYLRPSVDALDPDARRLWFAVGLLHVPDFGAWTAAAAVEIPIPRVEAMLDYLVDRGLADVAGTDAMGVLRYRVHRLVGLYACERAVAGLSAAERHRLLDRAADCWLGLEQRARQLLSGVPEDSELLECPSGACETMIEMVRSDPAGWLLLEAEGLRFAAEHRGLRSVPTQLGIDRWDFETDVTTLDRPVIVLPAS